MSPLLSIVVLLMVISTIHATTATTFDDAFSAYLKRYDHPIDYNSGKLLISTTRGTLGLGNRMMAHASALAVALFTNRTLLLHAPDVDMTSIFTVPHGRMILSQRDYNRFFKHGKYEGTVARLDVSHDAGEQDWRQLVCPSSASHQADVLVLTGGQYHLPLFMAKHELYFRSVFADFSTVYHQIVRTMFAPSPAVQSLIDATHKRHSVGLQLRSFKLRYERRQDQLAEKCMERHNLPTDSIFIASLYREHRRYFAKNHGNVHMLSAFERQSNKLEQYQYALAEMLILAQSRSLIVSPYSTFGYTAIAYHHYHHDHDHQVFMLDQRVACRRVFVGDREPCFHKAPRDLGECPDGSPVWPPNRDRLVRSCPDYHKRGVKLY